ncbi:[acyl-carrier-protein] S-malonyltransferase [Tistlia consotensis]|uniref:Malonyl CoA-acyl carrier protein transacylase n=1 Tax=Tistlia consotensis USBA 355 TaxID=560819 RepID=A0A1Y6CN40_9PROT|nr:ACP S-malonyltransferase [Tistlia consotensis]SMF76460.1 [Acyl-carrier-protein] S-malonyltransferase [Tistlia consotensis USBA 355]SNS12972.1 [acyl-carrier-protein] S-malonyltransferase [Tistlia consotensis]
MRAFVFPGQGSQAVGMGQALAEAFPAARLVFEEVDDALSQKLSKLMFEGPESELTLTENAQPALMAVSLAVVRVLEREGGFELSERAAFVAGHSLGEYSALCAARCLDLADAARLLKRRGRAMQRAVPVGEGAMAALLGLELEGAREVAEAARVDPESGETQVCQPANDNAPGQVVVSGHKAAVERAVALAAEKGARRAIILPVSAPFHCALMQPAADEMAEALAEVTLASPVVPLISNVTASPQSDPTTIRRLLVEQVTGLVRWRESVAALRALGVERLVEAGAGKVLTGLAKRIDRELAAEAIGTPAEVEAFLKGQ